MLPGTAAARTVTLFDGHQVAGIVHSPDRSTELAAAMLARDLRALTGADAAVSPDLAGCRRVCAVIGTIDSDIVKAVAADAGVELAELRGTWERYARVAVRSRRDPSITYLLIAGSDRRGTIWGVVDLTREMGVSAWEWWADVTPRRVARLAVDGTRRTSATPSVQYRGIFLNDEDWGLQPWAARTFEPEVGDIGPKTYARIFELMWRLKANLIWPAMHDSTRPFYEVPGNARAAQDHAIVVGTSHAEPMMRNNVREWDEAARGPFNFFTNRAAMVDYWRARAGEVAGYENIYSIGLRGKHDSGMEGAATPEAARAATAEAMRIQRDLLATAQKRPASAVPQVLTLYKEVLDIYGSGLRVPEDVTLIWPEDNYGYISQLPTPAEAARAGGAGVYYHISYWGRPHDYLWLATTHPALVREQMGRAWATGARKLWVVNVGDIKPAEYLTQYFLDLAFDHRVLDATARDHLRDWAGRQFGAAMAGAVAGVMTEYYDLAFERRPEFIGFSQTEPTRPIRIGDYVRTGGGEALDRIARYAALKARADALAARMPADRRDAFFQLVLYPVRGAANINERNLKLDLAALYARQGRASVTALGREARRAHGEIVADTAAYNAARGGKWRGMMDMAPRRLPVFAEPSYPTADVTPANGCSIDASDLVFVAGRPATHRLVVSAHGKPAAWALEGGSGLTADRASGTLSEANGYRQELLLRYDGADAIAGGAVRCDGQRKPVTATLLPRPAPDRPPEIARTISLAAADAVLADGAAWERIAGLGSRGAVLRSRLTLASRDVPEARGAIGYAFHTGDTTDAELRVVALPVHPLTSANRLRVAVRIDGGPFHILDFETHGRSETWKAGVLANSTARTLPLGRLPAGAHRVEVVPLDPGFLLDRLDVRLDGAPDFYGAPPTR